MNFSADFFEGLEQHFNRQLPFVTYRKPNALEIKAILQKDNKLHLVTDYSESGFVFAPFDDRKDAILIPFDNSETIYCNTFRPSIVITPQHKEEDYRKNEAFHMNLVEQAIEFINDGKLKKVVVSRSEFVKLSETNPIKLFKHLLQSYRTAFVYCWYHPKIGLWLGATPETLLNVKGNRFETMALAGTQLYTGTLEVDWKNKEKDEQQFVTDFIVNSLKPLVDSLKVSDVETLKAGNILHLLTRISGTIEDNKFNFKNFIKGLHPTPAICGIPREVAKQFILENENYDREFYTGFLGELNIKNSSKLFVNLRCMQLKNKEAIIYVGGGITKDSIPEKEWLETVNKTNTIKKVLL